MKKPIIVLIFLFLLAFTAASQAGTVISGLMGGDITDPGNKISVSADTAWTSEAQWKGFYEGKATWQNIQSYERGPYSSTECPSNLFNNLVSWGAGKWFDSHSPQTTSPTYVTVQFPEAFVLTHFTLTSGNDSWDHGRQPNAWTVYGSNDGTNWTTIYHANSAADFTQVDNQTILYTSFTSDSLSSTVLNSDQQAAVTKSLGTTTISTADYATPGAYSWYKLEVTSTTGKNGGGGPTQLEEWELFGNTTASSRTSGNPLNVLTQSMNHVGSVYSLDAQDTASLTYDTETKKVSAWADTNSNGTIFSQSTEAFRPTLSTITINGKEFNALEFTKVTRTTENPQGGQVLVANKEVKAQTVFILAQNDIDHSLTGIWGQSADFGLRLQSDTGLWQDSPGNESDFINSKTGTPNGKYYYNGTDRAEFSGKLQNNLVLTEAARDSAYTFGNGTNKVGSYFIWDDYNVGSRGYDGKILEVVVYDRALTDYETKLINTGFAMKYGIQIANTLDIFPTSASTTQTMSVNSLSSNAVSAYKNDLIGIINFSEGETSFQQFSSGMGGLGIYGKIEGTRIAGSAFDVFLTTYQTPAEGTQIYAVSNIPAGTDAGILTNISGIKSSTYDKWEKEWYFSNKSVGEQDNWEITLEFNAEDAKITGLDDYADAEWYLISKTEDDEYFRFADLEPQKFNEKSLSFTFPANLLQTGYYTIGVMTSPELPEPAAWVMILIGIAGIWKMKSGRR